VVWGGGAQSRRSATLHTVSAMTTNTGKIDPATIQRVELRDVL
jgi:hypothetical protein